MQNTRKYLLALSTYAGTIIGVGLFGLPFVAMQIGFIPIVIYFIILGWVIFQVAMMYAEVVSRTPESHRLPGYAELYLGRKYRNASLVSHFVGLNGTQLAYILVGGGFLSSYFQPLFGGPALLYHLVFFTIGAAIVYIGTKSLGQVEFLSLGLFFAVMITMFVMGWSSVDINNLLTFNPKQLILPYGVILFSLGGFSVIPEIKDILKDKGENLMSKVILGGTILPIITYLIFIFLILGVTGTQTSPEAMNGLQSVLGDGVVKLGLIFGIITTFTSYLTIGIGLKKIYWFDLKIPHGPSWAIAIGVPLALFLAGLNNFLAIIGLLGAVLGGVEGFIMFKLWRAARKKSQKKPVLEVNLSQSMYYGLLTVMILGGVAELVRGVISR